MRGSSYASLARRFASDGGSPSQELRARLRRLDEIDPKINAFAYVAREAALAAAVASDRRWSEGAPLSPIDGMPVGVKDIIETEDMPTGQGSPIWQGFETRRDASSVQALREAGAVILGKTVTTEFAFTEPLMPVPNPHDPARTSGGSSSGSAAAVGAGILPAALGTQVVGSTLRPASFNGCVGFKPTFGALNRSGSFDHLSQSCLGILAATPEDAWTVASAIAQRVGGDPGYPGLKGPATMPAAQAPRRLAVLETAGWDKASDGARTAFAAARRRLGELDCEIADRRRDAKIETLEQAIAEAVPLTFRILDWELRWPLGSYEKHAGLSDALRQRLAGARKLSLDDYRAALRRRQDIRDRYAELAGQYDAFITLGATGAAPIGLGWTGDPVFNVPASLLGAPAISLPLLFDQRMPLGLQIIGHPEQDAHVMAVAQWVWQSYIPTGQEHRATADA
jgi:Asp-tRNA(Asn)/Glu-tRNA(Gln) amidotransferase A subunit family amidase